MYMFPIEPKRYEMVLFFILIPKLKYETEPV